MDYKATVKELLQSKNKIKFNSPTKKEIYKACKFNNKEKHIFYALEMISFTKDLRNATDDYIHCCFSNFYNEVSKRTGFKKEDIEFLWDEELANLLTGKSRITSKLIEKKKEFCAAIAAHKSVEAEQYYVGEKAREYHKYVSEKSNKPKNILPQSFIKGVVASIGVATGIVKIIHSATEIEKVKKGDILVAGMTSPKYMPAIFNSGAIITDDGGLTCHAAIIARELKKPCIIGTKIATSILNDGDLVEVNADNGIIKVIKRIV
ncbi:hypothetical protein HY797_03260 [Candidatus Falkowbacteria bacterium]|nr:hypothetical protein [Candidatus Falkowbacteria bacterium]